MSDGQGSRSAQDLELDSYAVHFQHHLDHFRAHLAGKGKESLLPSFHPPAGYWTKDEKELFFRLLARHSRLRPDLIADSIKSKTVLDVCTYIDTLDEGWRHYQHLGPIRHSAEQAFEVSDSWAEWEDQAATSLVDLEQDWEAKDSENQLQQDIAARKASMRPLALQDESTMPTSDFHTWEISRRLQERQRQTFQHLNSHHLRVIDYLRRHDSGSSLLDERSHPEDQSPQTYPEPPLSVSSADRHSSSSMTIDATIDPVLMNTSRGVHSDSGNVDERQSLSSPRSPQMNPVTSFPHAVQTAPNVPPLDGHIASPDDRMSGEVTASHLSPKSRRRIQKRLYMRRKRAEMKKERAVTDISSDQHNNRIPRKRRHREDDNSMPSSRKTSSSPPATAADDAEHLYVSGDHWSSDDDEEFFVGEARNRKRPRHSKKGGLIKRYKVLKEFSSIGIDVDVITRQELELFHLSTLGHLIELHQLAYDDPESSSASSISADTIRILISIVTEFTRKVVHHAVVLSEQDRNMKGDTKVWRRNQDEITHENVVRALDIMGLSGLSKEKHFSRFIDNSSGESESKPDEEDRRVGPSLQSQSSFVYLPKSYARQNDRVIDWNNEEDMEDLNRELGEEQELDENDAIASQRYEQDLWVSMGRVGQSNQNR